MRTRRAGPSRTCRAGGIRPGPSTSCLKFVPGSPHPAALGGARRTRALCTRSFLYFGRNPARTSGLSYQRAMPQRHWLVPSAISPSERNPWVTLAVPRLHSRRCVADVIAATCAIEVIFWQALVVLKQRGEKRRTAALHRRSRQKLQTPRIRLHRAGWLLRALLFSSLGLAPPLAASEAVTAAAPLAAVSPGLEAGSNEAPVDLDNLKLAGGVVAARASATGAEDASPGADSAVVQPPAPRVSWKALVLLHVADGLGVGGQLRVGNTGLRASVAYVPQYFIVDKDPWDDKFAHFELAQTAQLNVDAFHLFGDSERGVSLSYRYSTLLGHGLGGAYQSFVVLGGARFVLSVPVIYYPAARDRLEREFGLQGGERI